MNFCRSCEAQLQENSPFCRVCGVRTDIEKTFAPSEASKKGSTSFGDPSQRFGEKAQSFGAQSQGFGRQSQEFGAQSQGFGAQSQGFGQQPQGFGDPNQSFGSESARQSPSQRESQPIPEIIPQTPPPPERPAVSQKTHYNTSNSAQNTQRYEQSTQHSASQSNQQAQYPRQFEPYARQEQMYRQYQDDRQQHQDAPQILPEHERYKRLGGWLLLFVISAHVGIFLNLITSVRLINHIVGVWSHLHLLPDVFRTAIILELIGGVASLSIIILQIIFVSSVLNRRPIFLRVEQLSYIALLLVQICFAVSASMAGMFAPGTEAFELIARPFAAVVGMLLMTAYYSRSVRVRVYMGSDEYKRKALFSFSRPMNWPY